MSGKDKTQDYDLALALLFDMIHFGSWLGSAFKHHRWYDFPKYKVEVQVEISHAAARTTNFFDQLSIETDRFGDPQVRVRSNNYFRGLKDSLNHEFLDLLRSCGELQPLRSMIDAVCAAYIAMRDSDPNPTRLMNIVIGIFHELMKVADLLPDKLEVPHALLRTRFPSLKTIEKMVLQGEHSPKPASTPEPVMPQIQVNLPSPEQAQGMDRAALVGVLASPEVATALKALGITAVGPTMPLRALRALVEALRAVSAMQGQPQGQPEPEPEDEPKPEPKPEPEPEPEPEFTNEPNIVKRIYGEVSRLKIKDLSLVHSPFAWPNAFLVEWRGWSDHSGTPHYIQVVSNPYQGAPGILVCLLARTNSGPTQVGHMGCKPDVQDFLHATAKVYANALTQLGVTPYEVKAPPSSFAQDVAAHMLSTPPVSASWDPAIGPDDVPF